MTADTPARRPKARCALSEPPARVASKPRHARRLAIGPAAALEEARRTGLLDGDKTEHLSFRAPPALVEAAKRESGVRSPTKLGILALAVLAQPDAVAAFLKRTYGRLGESHELEY
jgi:hypothetical protein